MNEEHIIAAAGTEIGRASVATFAVLRIIIDSLREEPTRNAIRAKLGALATTLEGRPDAEASVELVRSLL